MTVTLIGRRNMLWSAVWMVAIAAMAGCSTAGPEHYTESFELEGVEGGESVVVTDIHQESEPFGASPDVMTSLAVDLKFEPGDGADEVLEREDVRLVADVPEGKQLVAGEPDESRSPDQIYLRRDGDWIEVETVEMAAADPTRVRVEFDSLLPFVEPVREDRQYYRAADLRLEVPNGGGGDAGLALTDTSTHDPVWTRRSAESRFFGTVTAEMAEFSGGFGAGMTFGHQARFRNGLYFRGGVGTHFRDEHFRLEAPLMIGNHFDLGDIDLGVGAGWSFAGSSRLDGGDALSHWANLEMALGRSPGRTYPYRSSDFLSDFSFYSRFSYRLGNFDGPLEGQARYMLSVGLAVHPAGRW